MRSTITIAAICLLSGIYAPTLNVNDKKSIGDAQKGIAASLMSFYRPSTLGTIPEKTSEEADGFQWFEMGFFWMAMMEYTEVGNDFTYFETMSGALANASFGRTASFLGDPNLEQFSAATGKWNDDILWWALAALHGAEIAGRDYQTPLKSTLFDIARNTYIQVRDQWDENCSGGLYWARNRNDAVASKRTYKSTITNVEQIILAVRLYKLTNEREYLDHAIKVYDWLVGPSNLVTSDGRVLDGTHSNNCDNIVESEHSYNAGLFLGGAALLFDATKDNKYMSDIRRVLGNYEKEFVRSNIYIDPCEVDGSPCKKNQAQFKGVAIYSLNYVYKYSSDESVKQKIETWIETSARAMAETCDTNWRCSNFWLPGASDRPVDVHNQMNALFMSNSLSSIRSATVEGGRKKPTSNGAATTLISIGILSSVFALTFLI